VIHEDALTRDEERRYLIEGRPIPPQKLIAVKNGAGWEGYIEAEFLKPVIQSLREIKTLRVYLEDVHQKVFMCHKSKNELRQIHQIHTLAYIEWGEYQNYHKRPTCKGRFRWWDLGKRSISDVLYSYILGDRHLMPLNCKAFADNNLFDIWSQDDPRVISAILSSLLFRLLLEPQGREMTGALAVLKVQVYELERTPIPDPSILTLIQRNRLLAAFEQIAVREIKSIFEETGLPKPNCDYSNIDPKNVSLDKIPPDRRALDQVIFEVLDLTEEEQLEVYRAVVELVKNRLVKARSV